MGVRNLPGGKMNAQNATVHFLIQVAYGVREFQVTAGPTWTNSERFDITAKGDEGAKQTQIGLMMQSLLADRFKLAVHRETREMPVYNLVASKGGIKLTEPKEGSCVIPGPNGPQFTPGQPMPNPCGMMRISPKGLDGFRIGMRQLTVFFSDMLGRPILDKTGFNGTFDVHFEFARDEALASGALRNIPPDAGGPSPQPVESSAPSIFTAAQEQLGLRLESGRGPVEILVIDHIERPTEN
jgi:uncharacterized protein (TIGR03435 family)